MKTILNKNKAFTLAEVLITLGIIGVVAAMTIPTLMNKTQDLEFRTALKKNFSVFSGVYGRMQVDGGSFQDAVSECTNAGTKNTCLKDIIKTYMSVVKECDANASTGVCFPTTVYNPDKTVAGSISFLNDSAAGLILSDGTMVKMMLDNADCSITRNTIPDECGWVTVDVNGDKKPNTWGKDIYNFMFYKDRLRPTGTPGDGLEFCTPSTSYGCAAKYLQGN